MGAETMNDRNEEAEVNLENRVVRLLHERPDDEETRTLLGQLVDEKQRELDTSGNPDAQFHFTFWFAQFYLDAGLPEEALQALYDARNLASQEERAEYHQQATEWINRLRGLTSEGA